MLRFAPRNRSTEPMPFIQNSGIQHVMSDWIGSSFGATWRTVLSTTAIDFAHSYLSRAWRLNGCKRLNVPLAPEKLYLRQLRSPTARHHSSIAIPRMAAWISAGPVRDQPGKIATARDDSRVCTPQASAGHCLQPSRQQRTTEDWRRAFKIAFTQGPEL